MTAPTPTASCGVTCARLPADESDSSIPNIGRRQRMFLEEAQWIGNILGRYERAQISPMLNMGSGTRYFRMIVQPHIDRHIFEELSKRSIDVVHCDMKMEDGVDIAGDMFDSDCQRQLAGH